MSEDATRDHTIAGDVPLSVRLGTVVPPEDPEDWRRPLTWVAAGGMLLAPIMALAWLLVAPPADATHPLPGTWLLAFALVIGGVVTGSTQLRPAWAFAATLGSALFGALVTAVLTLVAAPQSADAVASPALVHVVLGSLGGLCGALAASTLMPTFARMRSRWRRGLAPAAIGMAAAALVVQLVFNV